MKKLFAFILVVLFLAGCSTQAQRVSHNVSKEADAFNVQRRLVAINLRTDKPIFEVVGLFSVQESGNDLDVIVEVAPNVYKKNWFRLNEWVTYSVEDISGAYVNKYHYEINFQPEMIIPISFTSSD